jgi:hypothetical protein
MSIRWMPGESLKSSTFFFGKVRAGFLPDPALSRDDAVSLAEV